MATELCDGELNNNKLGLVQVTLSIRISILCKSYRNYSTCTIKVNSHSNSIPNHFQWQVEIKCITDRAIANKKLTSNTAKIVELDSTS